MTFDVLYVLIGIAITCELISFKIFMINESGLNLKNGVAHGLFEFNQYNGYNSRIIIIMLITVIVLLGNRNV